MGSSTEDNAYVPSLDDWIIVPGWNTFQHYGNRKPVWIKVYTALLHDPNYLSLSLASRGLLLMIWLAYSQENGQISVRLLTKLFPKKVGIPQLISLNQAGFLDFSASKPLAQEEEVDKETPLPPSEKNAAAQLQTEALNVAADWTGGSSLEFDLAIDELQTRYRAHLPKAQREYLWDIALKRGQR